MEILGYILASIIGLSISLFGGGGNVLGLPILVYAFGLPVKEAICVSLLNISIISLINSCVHLKNKIILWNVVFIFLPFTILGTYLGSHLNRLNILSDFTLMSIVCAFTIIVSLLLYKSNQQQSHTSQVLQNKYKYLKLISIALLAGFFTGLIGIGGGFIIVPSLLMIFNIEFKKAVATALILTFFNTFTGFMNYLHFVDFHLGLASIFILCSCGGLFLGNYLLYYLPSNKLKKYFAIFLTIIAITIIIREYIFALSS